MQKRIFGLETEYGIAYTNGQRNLLPEEISRYIFKSVLSWGRTSNIFLSNGSRLYLDVGSHPEYATAECDSILDVVACEKAGDAIVIQLVKEAQKVLLKDGHDGVMHIIKNNSDMVGNSFGSHENYLMSRTTSFEKTINYLVPYLVSRIIFCGSGRIVGEEYHISQRSEFMWEAVSSATTRSRPMINTRDEPHSDSELYRRLHVIVGDSNISQIPSILKFGLTHLILRVIEEFPECIDTSYFPKFPVFALKTFSSDIDLKAKVECENGSYSAFEIMKMYYAGIEKFSQTADLNDEEKLIIELFKTSLEAIENSDSSFLMNFDWYAKYSLLEKTIKKENLLLNSNKPRYIDALYHNLSSPLSLNKKLNQKKYIDEDKIEYFIKNAPKTTRANLRSQFIVAAQESNIDYTVDWIHLKINDQSQRTCVLKDPFISSDERVDKMIERLKN